MAEHNTNLPAGAFFHALAQLSTGERAALKRESGRRLTEASGGALAAFYRVLPADAPQGREGRYYAIACLSCLWKAEELRAGRSFADSLRAVRADGHDSFDQRIRALLDCVWDDDDGYLNAKLARLVKQMRQNGIQPNFSALLEDLIFWNLPDRLVQRRWARSYFGIGHADDPNPVSIPVQNSNEEA